MTARENDRFARDIGAYLLGALEDGEQRAFEAHLAGCEACRQEVVRLEVARDALPRGVDQVPAPERLKVTLMETVRAEAASAEPSSAPARAGARRSRRRWREVLLARPRFAAAAAAVLLAVGVAAGALVGALGGGGDDSPGTVAAQVDESRMPSATASLVVPPDADAKGGAILHVEGMQQPRPGHVYEVWIKRGDKVKPSSLFTVDRNGRGAAAIPDHLSDADAVLVTREPDGGSTTPSEPSLVTVPLPS